MTDSILKRDAKFYILKILSTYHTTQHELSLRLGVTPQHLSGVKNGRITPHVRLVQFLKVLAFDKKAWKIAGEAPTVDLPTAIVEEIK